ncbi:MAG: chemotaxis protein CheD [Chloroflexi bacterium]|nr:chemotaxis protein CheD [Chloroflexota bacterium]MBV9133441.1 chemotaxis protein CheD [Chloroflexota bacterium]MBV9898320.1 chemotaxis protein CheD [Chloroflexota bacterium]
MTIAAIPQGQSIPVGLGEVAVQKVDSAEPLVAHGLGSCIALCLFDPVNKVAGLAHVVLPGSDPQNAPNGKFAGSALPALLQAMARLGGASDPRRLQARLAGGAHVLAIGGTGSLPRIGDKNAEAVKAALAAASVPVMAEDCGGGKGRTVWFHPRDNGRIRVRTVGGTEVQF